MPERRTWETVLLSSMANGTLLGTAAGAATGAAAGTVIRLTDTQWKPASFIGALATANVYGGVFGGLAGSIIGLLAGFIGGLLAVVAGGSLVKRSTARAIGAVSPGLAGLLLEFLTGTLARYAYLILILTAIGAPLGIWRAPRVAHGSRSRASLRSTVPHDGDVADAWQGP